LKSVEQLPRKDLTYANTIFYDIINYAKYPSRKQNVHLLLMREAFDEYPLTNAHSAYPPHQIEGYKRTGFSSSSPLKTIQKTICSLH
jgi:hypothetical protein